jgi:FkbM family methyltransferase
MCSCNIITEKEIHTIYGHLFERSPKPDEVAHWISVEATTDTIKNELLASYELWQKNKNKFRVLVTTPEFKIYAMQNDSSIGAKIIRSKSFESHVADAIKRNLKTGDIFIDLGANIGFFTLLAASIVESTGKVISVEPNMQNLQLLYSSILENQFENIKVLPFAASDRSQILNLTVFGSNGLVRLPNQSNSQFVQSVRIDELIDNELKINVVKLDVEGYEPLAIKGMDNIIRKHKPIIISEFNPWHIQHGTKMSPKEYLRQLYHYDYSLSILERSGGIIPNVDIYNG